MEFLPGRQLQFLAKLGIQGDATLIVDLRFRAEILSVEQYVLQRVRIVAILVEKNFIVPPGRNAVHSTYAPIEAGYEQLTVVNIVEMLLENGG